jgi:RNA polymerase sigma-70 factor, ECF subfamily
MKDRSVKPLDSVSTTDSTLLRGAAKSDQAAWRDLVETYSGRVYRWARKAGLQDSDAADVTNQVFASVTKGLAGFRREDKSATFRGWLRRITQNAVTDWRRLRAREQCQPCGGSENLTFLQLKPDQPSATTHSHQLAPRTSPESRAIEQVRLTTPPDKWRIFWLLTAEEMSPEEVALECNVTLNVVYLTKHRITKRIREQLEGTGH